MADSFYSDPSAELNQGDILEHIPWGLIEAPTTLCRPDNRKNTSGKARYGSVAEWKSPLAWTHDPEIIHGIGWEGLAIVLWHGCQLDKWKNRDLETGENTEHKSFAAIAPIVPLESFQPAERRGEVTARQHHSYFPLPPLTVGARQFPDSYVDLRHIWSVRQSLLTDRLASISDGARLSLYEHMFTFFTRFRLDITPKCPTCGTEVQLTLAEDHDDEVKAQD